MKSTDLTQLADRLTQLADALGGKPPSAGAMKVWFDVLSECSFAEVLNVLTDWPKSHAKSPLPAEVLKLCLERISDRLEAEARARAMEARKPWSPSQLRGDPNSPAYLEFKREWERIKNSRGIVRRMPRAA